MSSPKTGQPWIHSALFDSALTAGPPALAGLLVLIFKNKFSSRTHLGPWSWLILVVGLDVAHVYSSIFRTYFDRSLESRSSLLTVPVLCWMVGVVLYAMGSGYFWTGLAYLAVFHFVRQQYGFAMIYSRTEKSLPRFCKELDRVMVYAATLYPLFYWHTHLPRNFNWFTDGDFVPLPFPALGTIAGWIYLVILLLYAGKEIWLILARKHINLPRNLLILGTALSWYVGIVWLNNDLAFTFSNVVAHGVPYIALIWLYGRKNTSTPLAVFRLTWLPAYLGILIALAYFEEGLWDGFVWRDHSQCFPIFSSLPALQNPVILAVLVPLLALPQSTHYIFDAFLWRNSGPESGWKNVLFSRQENS